MNLNFEINVQCKGDAAGTLGWLNSLLSDGELVIKNNVDGIPSLFFHYFHKSNGEETKPNEGNMFIATMTTEEDMMNNYPTKYDSEYFFGENVIKFVFVQSAPHKYGFVDMPLTPAAYNKLENFIYKAKEMYKEWWMKDGKEV